VHRRGGLVAVPVAVGVRVERDPDALVDELVAVLVDPVADLLGPRVDGGVGVVAVPADRRGRHAVRGAPLDLGPADPVLVVVLEVRGLEVLVHRAVAVVVLAVALLGRVRADLRVRVVAVVGVRDGRVRAVARVGGHVGVAVAVMVGVGVPGLGQALVDRAVAVVVLAVAALDRGRADVDVRVVAVQPGDEPVPVGVDRGTPRGEQQPHEALEHGRHQV
jgi:hypothetical protein